MIKSMRYERQLFFKHIGKEGQEKLRNATVTIVGLGALGTHAAELLCRAGIGRIILIDDDTVEIHNLQRQSLYDENDIGKKKVQAAQQHLNSINSEVTVTVCEQKLSTKNLHLLQGIVIDGTDTMDVRYRINSHCYAHQIPWIYGAVASAIGMVYVVAPGRPCLECILPHTTPTITCEADGVMNTICALVASVQVTECIKYIVGTHLDEHLLRVNIWDNEWQRISVKKRSDCVVCSGGVNTKKNAAKSIERFIIQKCRNRAAYSLRERRQGKIDLEKIKNIFDKIEVSTPAALIGRINKEAVIVHPHGEILFTKCEDKEKMKLIAAKVFE